MSDMVTNYDIQADREAAVVRGLRKIWEAKHAPPQPPKIHSNVWKFIAGFMILLFAAINVSGAHTIPLFRNSVEEGEILGLNVKDVVGVSAFVMIEVGMIMLAISRIYYYTSTQKETWEQNNRQVSFFITVSIVLIFSVALFANVYSTLSLSLDSEGATTPEDTTQQTAGIVPITTLTKTNTPLKITPSFVASVILFALMGSAAPVLTLLSGEVIGKVLVSESAKRDSKMRKHEEEKEAYNAAFLEDLDRRKKQKAWKVETPEATPIQPVAIEAPKAPEVVELQPIYVDRDRRQCPHCDKTMHRASWTRHPCRFQKGKPT